MAKIDTEAFRVKPGQRVKLGRWPQRFDADLSDDQVKQKLDQYTDRLRQLQERMFAEGGHRLLIVLQAMDTAGKDSTIRRVFGPLNPQGVRVHSFKAPSTLERAHDFLWRIHRCTPPAGHIAVFNRSHYEDVLIVRVRKLAPQAVWSKRYQHINDFEKMLADEGTTILKLYLHISKAYQKQRLQRRLDRPDKHWKFNPDDLAERKRWGAYRNAYEAALSNCSTPHAPWYVIPAEARRNRDLLVTALLTQTLEALKMKYPKPTFDPSKIVID